MEGAVVVEDSGDVVAHASDAIDPVGDWEGEDVAGDGESNEAENLEISFLILWTETEIWL